jgi:thioredoxin 2
VVQVACPRCLTANRIPGERLGEQPKCGKCGTPLLEGAPLELAEAAFDDYVARTQLPVVADFWAPWCGPCRAMAPHFERAAAQLAGKARLVKVNTEEAQNLAARMNIRAIPTLVLFRNGVEAKRVSGALDTASLVQWVS